MARINVYDYPDEESPTLAGHFDPEKAALIREDTRWSEDAGQHVSIVSGGRYTHEGLYRTAGGRWVLNRWSQWQGDAETYQFIDDETAKDWLERNESYGEVERYFGQQEEESGPPRIGRPEIGGRVTTALGEERLAWIDAYAAQCGIKRAEAFRQLVDIARKALGGQISTVAPDRRAS